MLMLRVASREHGTRILAREHGTPKVVFAHDFRFRPSVV